MLNAVNLEQYRWILDELYEYRSWILGFSALCGFVALIGGGIKVRDLEIPRTSWWVRLASLLTSLAFFTVFVLIRAPENQKTRPSGQIIFSGQHPERIRLELWPVDSIASSEFSGGNGSEFTFPKPVEVGNYRLRILSIEGSERSPRVLGEIPVQVAPNKPLRLSQKADGKFLSGDEKSLVDHLVRKYKDKDWREQIIAIEQLSDLAYRDATVNSTLSEMVRGRDQNEAILAAFSLSHNCVGPDQATKNKLKEIWEGPSNRYVKIRARAAQQCDESEGPGVETDLLEIVRGRAVLVSRAPLHQQVGLRTTAAYFLATVRTAQLVCVVDTLISALESPTKLAQDRAYEGLKVVTGARKLPPKKAEWESWWSGSKSEYKPCEE